DDRVRGVGEAQVAGDGVRDPDDVDPGGPRRFRAVRGVLERDRLVRVDTELGERFEVERRPGLRTLRVVVCGDNRVPAACALEPLLAVEPLPAGARGGLRVEQEAVEVEEKSPDRHGRDGIETGMAGETRRAVFAQPDWLRAVPTGKELPREADVVFTGCGTSFHAAQTGGRAVQALEAVLSPPRADILVCISHEGTTELTMEAERAFGGDVWLVTGNA